MTKKKKNSLNFRRATHLFHRGIVKQDPLGGLGVKSEGTVVTAGVADHPHELQVTLLGVLISHPVEELQAHKGREMNTSNSSQWRLVDQSLS